MSSRSSGAEEAEGLDTVRETRGRSPSQASGRSGTMIIIWGKCTSDRHNEIMVHSKDFMSCIHCYKNNGLHYIPV